MSGDEFSPEKESQRDIITRTSRKPDKIEDIKEDSNNKPLSVKSDEKIKTNSENLHNKFDSQINDQERNNMENLSQQHQSQEGFLQSGIGFREKENQIVQIVKGKYHLLKLTMDGKVYGSGKSYYGVVGLGGSGSALKPQLLPNLANIKVKQIAAGVYHSLALAQNGDLYTWGLGEEGN